MNKRIILLGLAAIFLGFMGSVSGALITDPNLYHSVMAIVYFFSALYLIDQIPSKKRGVRSED